MAPIAVTEDLRRVIEVAMRLSVRDGIEVSAKAARDYAAMPHRDAARLALLELAVILDKLAATCGPVDPEPE